MNNMNNNIDKLAENVVKLLLTADKRAACAESCTGGMISAALTSVSGSSQVFDMGICSYANFIKHEQLGVPYEMLEKYGAVSEQVASAMAKGVMQAAKSDYAVSTTGIAGPTGGTAEKPVGTVWIGVCSREKKCSATRFLFGTEDRPDGVSQREFIRQQAVCKALELLAAEIRR